VRKIGLVVLVVLALGAFSVIIPASASQSTPNKLGSVLRPGATSSPQAALAPGDVDAFNENFITTTYNHFADPSRGTVVAESWIEGGVDSDNNSTNIQAIARTILLPKALRTQMRVQLFGLVDLNSTPELINSSGTINSSGKLILRVAAPELSVADMATDPHCWFFQFTTLSIRWSDGRLTSGLTLDPSFAIPNFANPACQPT
jgi:hypothetical protein